jgi:UDPglucose 6-dehydrogenase
MKREIVNREKVIVVGAGVVGTATGQGFLHHGHNVTFVDSNVKRVEELLNAGLDATSEIDLSGRSSFVFLALPTPATATGGWDLSDLGDAVSNVGEALKNALEPHTVVVRSTVPPGTLDNFVGPQLERTSGKQVDSGFTTASAPEFLRGNRALQDFLSPWMTVLASRTPETLRRLTKLFQNFGGELRAFDDPVTAELIKAVHNAFNATKISFWNEMWQLSQRLGVSSEDVASTVARSAEGSTNPLYGIEGGFAYGGDCLPKDIDGLIKVGIDWGADMRLLESVRAVNDALRTMETTEASSVTAHSSLGRGGGSRR